MSVNLIWSTTNGGTAISSTVDCGSKANGEYTTSKELYLRHDGSNPITNVKLYIREFSGTYSGAATSSTDIAEMLAWGDATDSDSFGGVFVNMDAINSYPTDQWPTVTTKSPTYGFVCRTGDGDSEGNAVTISKNSYSSSGTDGEVLASETNCRFAVRFSIPNDEDTLGVRQIDFVATYSYTS